jgi:hypothetical protein
VIAAVRPRRLSLVALLAGALLAAGGFGSAAEPEARAGMAIALEGTTPGPPGVMRGPVSPPGPPPAPPPAPPPSLDFGTYLVIEAAPPAAHVFLDGRFLGPAALVAGWMVPVGPGYHLVQVAAPGFRPSAVPVFAGPAALPTRIRVVLQAE